MTREEKIKEANSLLEQAAAMRLKAWEILSDEEEIDDALEIALDMSVGEFRDQLADDPGFKAYALLDHWEILEEEN